MLGEKCFQTPTTRFTKNVLRNFYTIFITTPVIIDLL